MEEFLFEADTELKLDHRSEHRLRHSLTAGLLFFFFHFQFFSLYLSLSCCQFREGKGNPDSLMTLDCSPRHPHRHNT